MPMVFQQISNHGTSHPVVARLQVQIGELLKSTSLKEEERQAIFGASFEASMRLIQCWDIRDKLSADCNKLETEFQPPEPNKAPTIPSIVGLRHEAETFLYEAKNFLRDLTVVINTVCGTEFDQAGQFSRLRNKDESEIGRWAVIRFGEVDPISKFLRAHTNWLGQIVKMRNAVEHPGGRSGTLEIFNYEMAPNIGIIRPAWRLRDASPTSIVDDMSRVCDGLFGFAEELIVLLIEKFLPEGLFEIHQIPEEQINPQCPLRFRVGLSEQMIEKFAQHQAVPK
jgi:hypothetical protein